MIAQRHDVLELDGPAVRLHFHAGQLKAWDSDRRIVAVIAGAQSGKTVAGPPWLEREIARRGPGDYLVAGPTYKLLERKVVPEFCRLFVSHLRYGSYAAAANKFTYSAAGARRAFGRVPEGPTTVFFGHADNPDSLESATVKAAWLDEVGQKQFKLESWEAIQRRVAVHQGRILITTTPYRLGWLKQKVFDPWQAARGSHPEIEVVNFRSIENPSFPHAEFERARRELPAWKFRMFYEGRFERPAGVIYDCFDEALHKVPRFAIPEHWPRHLGLDFGGVNTAGIFLAEELNSKGEKTGRLFAYREYKAGGRTAKEHAAHLLSGEPKLPQCVGGSKSEGQWRDEFRAGGLPVREPAVSDVEVGIDRVYGAIKRGELYVFADLAGLLDELASYSRELDELGNPTEKIEDKEAYHHLDALRYACVWLRGPRPRLEMY